MKTSKKIQRQQAIENQRHEEEIRRILRAHTEPERIRQAVAQNSLPETPEYLYFEDPQLHKLIRKFKSSFVRAVKTQSDKQLATLKLPR